MENINDLIYAYALGCLEQEEKQKFVEQISSKEFNIQELGEYQNLASLLPSILTIENPDPQLKDKVAKKLYFLKDEIKAHRQKNKSSNRTQEVVGNGGEITAEYEDQNPGERPIVQTSEFERLPHSTQDIKSKESNINELPNPDEKFISKTSIKDFNSPGDEIPLLENIVNNPGIAEENDLQNIIEETPDPTRVNKTFLSPPRHHIKRNNHLIIWSSVLFFLLVIGIIFTYLNITSKTNSLNHEVEKLKEEVGSLNMRAIGNQEIQEMLQSSDVRVINLKGTNYNPNSFGKLIIGSDKGIGYIQFAQMPIIPEDKLFQLWVGISGNFIPLKTFQMSDTMGFYSFKMLSIPNEEDISFLMTEESTSGSKIPSNKVYLLGTLKP